MVLKRRNEEGGSNSSGSKQACAACKHQRRKCKSDCVMAPYFTGMSRDDFDEIHKIFGVGNITKWLENHCPREEDKQAAAVSFKWEASAWKANPDHRSTPLGLYNKLQKEYDELQEKYDVLLTKLLQEQKQAYTPISNTIGYSMSQPLQHNQFDQHFNNGYHHTNHPHHNMKIQHTCPPPPYMMKNFNDMIDHHQHPWMMARPTLRYPPIGLHDDHRQPARGRGFSLPRGPMMIRPNSMPPPVPVATAGINIQGQAQQHNKSEIDLVIDGSSSSDGLMHYLGNSNNSNFFHGARSSNALSAFNQNGHDVRVPSNFAAIINPTTQQHFQDNWPLPITQPPLPQAQVRRSTTQTTPGHQIPTTSTSPDHKLQPSRYMINLIS